MPDPLHAATAAGSASTPDSSFSCYKIDWQTSHQSIQFGSEGGSMTRTRTLTPTAADVDRISGLPDELLHSILVRLPSTAAAAQTSVLSRRWRRVWAHLPALSFTGKSSPSTLDAVDAALSAYSARCLHRLDITIHDTITLPGVPAARACAWLRFASRRLAGELVFRIPLETLMDVSTILGYTAHVVELPPCDRVTTIHICITRGIGPMTTKNRENGILPFIPDPLLRLPAGAGAGCMFAALRALKIEDASLVLEDLERVVSEQSPCLQELELRNVGVGEAAHAAAHVELCIRSASLQRIVLCDVATVDRLALSCSSLLYLHLSCWVSDSISVAAPALSELIWNVMPGDVHENTTNITEAGRCLRSLETWCYPILSRAALFQHFDTVDELCLYVPTVTDLDKYNRFIEETERFPRVKILKVRMLRANNHGFAAMLHLLMRCGQHLETLKISMVCSGVDNNLCTSAACTRFVESCGMSGITLSELQKIEIDYFTEEEHVCGLLNILFMVCKVSPRRLAICPRSKSSKPLTGWTRMNIERLAYSCTKVEFLDPIP